MKKFLPYLVIIACIALVLSMRECVRRKVREDVIIQAATTGPDSGRIWHDAYDREHRRAEVATGDRKTMQVAYGASIDSIARLNKVSDKQIEQITWLTSEVRGYRALSVSMQPSVGGASFTFGETDQWTSFEGNGEIYHCDSVGHIGLHFAIRDSSVLTGIRKRAYHIGPLQFGPWATRQVDASSFNPDVHYTGQRSYRILDKPRRWTIGLQMGITTYDFIHLSYYAGAGITYNLISF